MFHIYRIYTQRNSFFSHCFVVVRDEILLFQKATFSLVDSPEVKIEIKEKKELNIQY